MDGWIEVQAINTTTTGIEINRPLKFADIDNHMSHTQSDSRYETWNPTEDTILTLIPGKIDNLDILPYSQNATLNIVVSNTAQPHMGPFLHPPPDLWGLGLKVSDKSRGLKTRQKSGKWLSRVPAVHSSLGFQF